MLNKLSARKKYFEDWLFPILSDMMTTPNCAYVVALIISYAVYKNPPTSLLELCNVLIQSYFQGVGLCILGYASNLASEKLMIKINEMWEWLKEMWEWLKEIKKMEQEIHKETHEKLDSILKLLKDR